MFWRRKQVALLAGVTFSCLFAQGAPHGQIVTRPLPIVIGALEPRFSDIARSALVSGSVELNVITDGTRVARVEVIKPNLLLDYWAQRDVATWTFAPHQPTSFRVTVEFEIHPWEFVDPASCLTRETPTVVTHDLPTRVHVIGHGDFICDKVELVNPAITVSTLAGQVVCDCPGRSPVGEAGVSYYREPTTRAELRGTYVTSAQGHIEADANGRFQVDNLPAGTYSVQVSGLAFNSRGYEVKVVRDGRPRPPLSLAIVPNPAVAEYLRLHPRETAFIATTQIPTYPIEALKAGIEGSVTMKVTPGRVPVAAGGPPLLVAAATAFARTWKTASSNNEPFDVSVKYRLAEGDCVGGGPRVVLRFPREVEITGKRIVPCGPG